MNCSLNNFFTPYGGTRDVPSYKWAPVLFVLVLFFAGVESLCHLVDSAIYFDFVPSSSSLPKLPRRALLANIAIKVRNSCLGRGEKKGGGVPECKLYGKTRWKIHVVELPFSDDGYVMGQWQWRAQLFFNEKSNKLFKKTKMNSNVSICWQELQCP